jgi:NADH:ubiquinone oxidoreductase subunit 6 (subunit J)
MPPELVEPLIFYLASGVVVLGALAVVFLPRIIHAALSLVLFFIGVGGVFILLHAEFVAAAQIIIYAGAITVLVLFAVMLTQGSQSPESNPFNLQRWVAALVAGATFAALLPAIASLPASSGAPGPNHDIIPDLGKAMLGQWVLPFEIASVLLLAAMIGAIVIAKERS